MRKLYCGQRGFTVVEVIVSVAILSMVMATLGTAIFQALGTERIVVDDGLAINELRKGLSYFSEDVKMTKTTNLEDGGAPVSSCTLSWTDEFQDAQTPHTSSYALVDDRLVRSYDGSEHTVAHRAVSVSFSRSGQTLSIQLETDAAPGATRTLSVSAVMRPDES